MDSFDKILIGVDEVFEDSWEKGMEVNYSGLYGEF